MDEPRTPSMDEKHIPSPPLVTVEQYHADKEAGINRWGHGVPEYGAKKQPSKKNANELVDGTLAYVPGVSIREVALDALKSRVERYREAWEKARDARDKALADCIKEKSHMPDNYWQAEHRARALYGSALQLLDALS